MRAIARPRATPNTIQIEGNLSLLATIARSRMDPNHISINFILGDPTPDWLLTPQVSRLE